MNSRDPSLALTSKKYQFRRVMSRVNGPEKGHSQHPRLQTIGFSPLACLAGDSPLAYEYDGSDKDFRPTSVLTFLDIVSQTSAASHPSSFIVLVWKSCPKPRKLEFAWKAGTMFSRMPEVPLSWVR